MIKLWLFADDVTGKFPGFVDTIRKSRLFKFAISRLVGKMQKRYPGIHQRDVLLCIAQYLIKEIADNDRSWIIGYSPRFSPSAGLQDTVERLRSTTGERIEGEDWLHG
jgi:hypothetical protein